MNLFVKLSSLILPGLSQHPQLLVSAYADDISVFVSRQRNVSNLSLSLDLYQKGSSAKVSWGKSEALQVGHQTDMDKARLGGDLRCGRQGVKVLGVTFLVATFI